MARFYDQQDDRPTKIEKLLRAYKENELADLEARNAFEDLVDDEVPSRSESLEPPASQVRERGKVRNGAPEAQLLSGPGRLQPPRWISVSSPRPCHSHLTQWFGDQSEGGIKKAEHPALVF